MEHICKGHQENLLSGLHLSVDELFGDCILCSWQKKAYCPPLGPFVGPFKVSKTGDNYRVEDTGTDSRIATCYDPDNAAIVAAALNHYAKSKEA